MSAIEIPGLDVQERSPGAFRTRVRVHPFFALTQTAATELDAVRWGCQQLGRLYALHAQLRAEGRLPASALTREEARRLDLAHLIGGEEDTSKTFAPALFSPGAAIFMSDVLDTYMDNDGKDLSPGYASRAKRLKNYFGAMALSCVTTATIRAYVEARLRGELGFGRSSQAAYATQKPRIPAKQEAPRARHPNGGWARLQPVLISSNIAPKVSCAKAAASSMASSRTERSCRLETTPYAVTDSATDSTTPALSNKPLMLRIGFIGASGLGRCCKGGIIPAGAAPNATAGGLAADSEREGFRL